MATRPTGPGPGSLQVMEDPRPHQRHLDTHPYHQHPLVRISAASRGPWTCQICTSGSTSGASLTAMKEDPVDHSVLYNCSLCGFDMCAGCFQGHLHPFHTHRLRRAKSELVYTATEGQWRCDACHMVYAVQTAYHCTQCQVDLCETCFNGRQKHSLHRHHFMTPVDPRILYRTHLSWSCDNCSQTFSSTSSQVFLHCSVCQFDLCEGCFRGNKHHLHQHPLTPVPRDRMTSLCSHCQSQPSSFKCTQDACNYSLCGACHMTKPRPHPLHPHPLELCDARVVYPQSEGLWHCDNCTRANLGGHQTPLLPHQPMYHCDDCEFDLCEPCYKKGLQTSRPFPSSYERPNRPLNSYEMLHRPPASYEHINRPVHSYELIHRPSNSLELGGRYEAPPTSTTSMLCLSCAQHAATHTFVHGRGRCTLVPIVCGVCAEEVLFNKKLCPYCKEVPDRTDRVN